MFSDISMAGGGQISATDLYGLLRLRAQVFVAEQRCPYVDPDGLDLLDTTTHLWFDQAGRPSACLRILDHGPVAQIGRVCTEVSQRGQGLAEQLLTAAHERIGLRGSQLDAQAHLAQWYQRFGYQAQGEPFDEDGIPHLRMTRTLA